MNSDNVRSIASRHSSFASKTGHGACGCCSASEESWRFLGWSVATWPRNPLDLGSKGGLWSNLVNLCMKYIYIYIYTESIYAKTLLCFCDAWFILWLVINNVWVCDEIDQQSFEWDIMGLQWEIHNVPAWYANCWVCLKMWYTLTWFEKDDLEVSWFGSVQQ